jgi:four helix bundle protein
MRDGEAQAAEAHVGFIYKVELCLKELRETKVWLRIIVRERFVKPASRLDSSLAERDQLISIFVTSIKTAGRKSKKASQF